MSDIIKLLPDHIANQIAAGEVVQRPASVVKELMENSIDSGADKIMLVVKDGGRTLVQVIDNGSGMSPIDARMSFERHATSKIATADDLFLLQTKGFRGEALASIAAIAHVEMKTKLHDQELGICLTVEGSKFVNQEPVSCANGTSVAVKNLFFNVPARRNFLGKDITEYQKILDEFLRIVLVHPEISFVFNHNGEDVYNLPAVQSLRKRIVAVFGPKFNDKLVPVNEETEIVKIQGYVTKPDTERATNDRCFFFVNNRYFKDRYFNHAIIAAYDGLIPSGKYPPYFLYFEVPTNSIDVNVHPTKTEIKFEENQFIYQILRSAVKQALGQNNIVSTLDFEQETSFNVPSLKKGQAVVIPEIKVNPNFNPFDNTPNLKDKNQTQSFTKQSIPEKSVFDNFFDVDSSLNQGDDEFEHKESEQIVIESSMQHHETETRKVPFQLNDKYIVTSIKNGMIIIDQYRAHCRILFDALSDKIKSGDKKSQQLLFPESFGIDKTELTYWNELIPSLTSLGFDLKLNQEEILINAVPAELKDKNPVVVLIDLMDQFRHNEQRTTDFQHTIISGLAAAMAIKGGVKLSVEEMQHLIDALYSSSSPNVSPKGKKIIETIHIDELTKRFN